MILNKLSLLLLLFAVTSCLNLDVCRISKDDPILPIYGDSCNENDEFKTVEMAILLPIKYNLNGHGFVCRKSKTIYDEGQFVSTNFQKLRVELSECIKMRDNKTCYDETVKNERDLVCNLIDVCRYEEPPILIHRDAKYRKSSTYVSCELQRIFLQKHVSVTGLCKYNDLFCISGYETFVWDESSINKHLFQLVAKVNLSSNGLYYIHNEYKLQFVVNGASFQLNDTNGQIDVLNTTSDFFLTNASNAVFFKPFLDENLFKTSFIYNNFEYFNNKKQSKINKLECNAMKNIVSEINTIFVYQHLYNKSSIYVYKDENGIMRSPKSQSRVFFYEIKEKVEKCFDKIEIKYITLEVTSSRPVYNTGYLDKNNVVTDFAHEVDCETYNAYAIEGSFFYARINKTIETRNMSDYSLKHFKFKMNASSNGYHLIKVIERLMTTMEHIKERNLDVAVQNSLKIMKHHEETFNWLDRIHSNRNELIFGLFMGHLTSILIGIISLFIFYRFFLKTKLETIITTHNTDIDDIQKRLDSVENTLLYRRYTS